ncbi:hypothetical protein E4U42_002314 [Claviceps africana]|uniref:Uncharacterized protein n=1 Tax=Claviceps africana TaxID=83212 RepID=A0A8K0JB47_9HYPO|nr:hypothetical protein E4U42_002314 [Claviceps africana]
MAISIGSLASPYVSALTHSSSHTNLSSRSTPRPPNKKHLHHTRQGPTTQLTATDRSTNIMQLLASTALAVALLAGQGLAAEIPTTSFRPANSADLARPVAEVCVKQGHAFVCPKTDSYLVFEGLGNLLATYASLGAGSTFLLRCGGDQEGSVQDWIGHASAQNNFQTNLPVDCLANGSLSILKD